VTAFLHAVCTGLRKLPLDRLDVERQILRTEAEHRSESIGVALALYRYGARGYGLAGLPEWGTHSLTAADVAAWAQAHFTRGNAALWIVGDDIPPGLHLDLPDGERRALPPESSALPMTPAWFAESTPVVVLESPVRRVPAATAYTRLLERGLFRELRQERGLSYVATAAYTTDGRQQARMTAIADGRPERLHEVLDSFLAQVHRLGAGDTAADELELVRAREMAALDRPDVEAGLLSRRATDLLCGFASSTTEELRAGLRALTAPDIRAVALDVERSALLMTPRFDLGPPPGFEPAPTCSRFAVTGTRHRSRAEPDSVLVLATDGVSVVRPRGPSTVLFNECVALLRFPDGARHLLGADGVAVSVEPTLYSLPAGAQARIDAAVAQPAHVDLPPRDPERIPRRAWANGLRARASATTRSLRMRLDRYAVFRGGSRNVLLSATLLLTSAVSAVLTIVLHMRLFGWIAAILLAFQLWRRWTRGHR
jgi:zinc protease